REDMQPQLGQNSAAAEIQQRMRQQQQEAASTELKVRAMEKIIYDLHDEIEKKEDEIELKNEEILEFKNQLLSARRYDNHLWKKNEDSMNMPQRKGSAKSGVN
ncbi:hypothetical protein PENTCL1PPCAC_10935, partial [Pristionchus entomophagus]